MLNCFVDQNSVLKVMQKNQCPSVYLDHCALRKISQDNCLATRFTTILKRRDGTLALSYLNLLEFYKVTDQQQIQYAEQFIDNSTVVICHF